MHDELVQNLAKAAGDLMTAAVDQLPPGGITAVMDRVGQGDALRLEFDMHHDGRYSIRGLVVADGGTVELFTIRTPLAEVVTLS